MAWRVGGFLVAVGWGVVVGFWMPRGPATVTEAVLSIALGLAAGYLTGYLTPVALSAAGGVRADRGPVAGGDAMSVTLVFQI
jgi:hypothetical protein